MRGIVVTKVRVEKEKQASAGELFRKYLLGPLTSGLIGYFGFFILLIISKYLGYLIGNRAVFQIDFTDFLISLLGFAFIFVVKMKENTKSRVL